MKSVIYVNGKTIALAFALIFTSVAAFAQAWNPGTATPATNIDRSGNVSIGLTTSVYSANNNKTVVNGGDVSYGASNAVTTNITSNTTNITGNASGRLSESFSYSAHGGMFGVLGSATATSLGTGYSNKIASAKGGQFAVNITNPISSPGGSGFPYEISGVNGILLGSITNYPTNGFVAAVSGIDQIKGTGTWGGYFEGRGYFENNVGIGTKTPVTRLDVRAGNIFQSPATVGSPFPNQFTAMGSSFGACNQYGFRAQYSTALSINVGIENAITPTISWANGNGNGNLDFDCDNNAGGCGTLVCQMTCDGPYSFSTFGQGYFSGGIFAPSDRNLKSSIKDYQNSLETIRQLRGVTYQYKSDAYPEYRFPAGEQVGFIAQEVMEVVPQAVKVDDNGLHAVNYDMIIPILVEGVKQLDAAETFANAQNLEQEGRIAELENEVAELKALVKQLVSTQDASSAKTSGESALGSTEQPNLDQNVPNPANGSTTISYFVPSKVNMATISITDLNGNLVAEYNADSGNGSVEISTRELPSGVYFYSLNLDGQKAATRRMVIAK